jgi:hypothetical protein
VGTFVPQISSKGEGLPSADLLGPDGAPAPDGFPESYAGGITEEQIEVFHRAMAERVSEDLIVVVGEPIEVCTQPRMWRMMVDSVSSSREGAEAWCRAYGFPEGECLPQEWTESLAAAAELEPVSFGQSAGSPTLMVPHWMEEDEDGTVLVDPKTGARLTVTQYRAGEDAPDRAELIGAAELGAAEPAEDWSTQTGFIYTGIAADDSIYYGRRATSPQVTVDLLWQYPRSAKERFDRAVAEGVALG